MRPRCAAPWALLALTPLLLAAADPTGDVAGCRGGSASGAPDLVEARGEILEQGTSARWTLTFSAPLAVPDRDGHPFRVEVAIRDPDVSSVSFAYYRRVNRLVRVDATVEHPTQILLLPERGANVFDPPSVEGPTMTIQVPGRTLSEDEDLTGTSPGLDALRWTVIVRDERACDFLGDGRPTQRMIPRVDVAPPREDLRDDSIMSRWIKPMWPWIVAGAVVALGVAGLIVYRFRR